MDPNAIDWDRVVHDPEYRRLVIEQLKLAAPATPAPAGLDALPRKRDESEAVRRSA
jgi:hypothetical protein